jgi:hypothetical protein
MSAGAFPCDPIGTYETGKRKKRGRESLRKTREKRGEK